MFNWLKKPEVKQEAEKPKKRRSLFSTHEFDTADPEKEKFNLLDKLDAIKREQPIFQNAQGQYALDDSSNGFPDFKLYDAGNNSVSDSVVFWYGSQGFIGAQLCGILAQNWLVNKACAMPGDDAIRKGYNVVSADGEDLDPEATKIIKEYDRRMKLNFNMREFIRKGRIFGIRIAMFKVESTDPDYYEKPFNIDGVTANSYKGIVQVDPYWTAPMLDGASASKPDTLHFYEPTWWIINGKKIHRSHLIIFRHAEPVDVLKPQYIYGGVPLTQQIMERVYAAERVSNEAPQLAMSKRTTVWLTDMEAVMGDTNSAIGRLQQWAQYRDNYGIKLGDKEGDQFNQFDTSLADFDALIMTQYQLVAAIAGVPATKLIGTTPKGFNSTGEYEEASYHELLESIQTHDLTPLAERHHALVIKSFVEPALKKKLNLETTLNWLPLDTPTAEELAATNLAKAQAGQVLIGSGALTSEDERQRVATDKTSGYNELGILENDLDENEDDILEGEVEEDLEGNENAQDSSEFEESKHPRASNGQFGSGGGESKSPKSQSASHKGSSETNGSPAPKAGQPFIVYRVAEREGLENRNAGNANGVALHIMNQQQETGARSAGNAPTHVYAYQVTPEKDVDGKYQGATHSGKVEGDKIGRVENQYGIAYSFPEKGYEAKLIGKVSLEDLKKQAGNQDFDDLGTKAGADLIRKNFEKSSGEDAIDAKWEESKHPRAKNGQFGKGGAGAASKSESEKSESSSSSVASQSKSEQGKQAAPKATGKYDLSKTKELANGGYIDKQGFEHSPNLSENERAIEDAFYREILKDTPKLIASYKKEFGNVIDPDLVKKLDPSFAKNPALAGAVHEPSSYLSKVIWKNALAEKKNSGDKSPVLFTAGGSGSGKSEAMGLAKDILKAPEDALTFDSVLGNFDKSTQKIQEALDGQDGMVDIVYTNAPLELAVKLNLQRGRTVKLDTQINAHFQASENIRKLADHYKDNPRVKITVVNNNSDPASLKEGKLSDVHDYSDKAAVRARMVAHATKLVQKNLLHDHNGKTLKDQKSKLKMLLD